MEANEGRNENAIPKSSPQPVYCDELFLPSKKKICSSPESVLIAAQNHFSMRPNIYFDNSESISMFVISCYVALTMLQF